MTAPTATVYPRACGGTRNAIVAVLAVRGLSPRVRGNRRDLQAPAIRNGSIPARAGEPIDGAFPETDQTVYPRACGGTAW